MHDWFLVRTGKSLAAYAATVTLQGGLALGGSGLAVLCSNFLGLSFRAAFAGGYLTALIPIVLWFRSGRCLTRRIKRWEDMIGDGTLDQAEAKDMIARAREQYRKGQGV